MQRSLEQTFTAETLAFGGIAISWKVPTVITLMGTASMTKQRPRKKRFFVLTFSAAVLLSLGIHFTLLKKAASWPVPGFSSASYDIIVPRTFRMKRVEIDSKILEEPKEVKRQEPSEKPVTLEKEIPAMEQSSRQVKDAPKGTLPSPLSPMTVETFETPSGVDAEKPLLPEAESLFGKEVSRDTIGDAPELMIPDTKKTTAARSGKTEKFTSLDDLLTGEPIKGQVPPILMPTDLLFEYDSDALKPEAAVTLSKLGNLIQKNATSGFRIEGHTDSFGSDLYNDGLSLRRAEAVKKWLQDTMGLPGNRITTIGLGKSRLLVPPSASVAEQQLNRRVEIIMSLPESTEKGH